jgi:hypothetical protein
MLNRKSVEYLKGNQKKMDGELPRRRSRRIEEQKEQGKRKRQERSPSSRDFAAGKMEEGPLKKPRYEGLVKGDAQPSLSTSNSDQGWQGTSAQTFEALLRKAVQELDVNKYQNTNELSEEIYKLYGENSEQLDFNDEEEKGYTKSLSEFLAKVFHEDEKLEEIGFKIKAGYAHYKHRIKKQPNESGGRYSLNIRPDRISDVVPKMIQEIATLPYVYDMKVASKKKLANKKIDNVIVFLYNSADGERKKHLEQMLRSYKEDTRPGHPAMLEPLNTEIQGIAFANENSARAEGTGWGRTRIRHIANVMWEFKLKEEEITFEKLLSKVKERYRENNIDPDNPYRDLPEEQKSKRAKREAEEAEISQFTSILDFTERQ